MVYNLGSDQDRWAYFNKVKLDFSRLGKPTDNPFIESFNGKFREGCLNRNWFLSFSDVRAKIELWRQDYNHNRPHSSLGNLTPVEFKEKCEPLAYTKDLCQGYKTKNSHYRWTIDWGRLIELKGIGIEEKNIIKLQ